MYVCMCVCICMYPGMHAFIPERPRRGNARLIILEAAAATLVVFPHGGSPGTFKKTRTPTCLVYFEFLISGSPESLVFTDG